MVARDFPKVKAAGSSPAVSSYPKIFENLLASFFLEKLSQITCYSLSLKG